MNIKKIINICKKNGQLRIFEGESCQWLSDGYACFPLIDCPIFTESSILRAYDISEKTAEKMLITHEETMPKKLDFSDYSDGETACDYDEPIFGGAIPIKTQLGIKFIDGKYLAPLAGGDDELLYIFERTTAGGETYFAIKKGFALVAVVMPYDCINEKFVDRLKEIYEQCEISLENKNAKGEAEQ